MGQKSVEDFSVLVCGKDPLLRYTRACILRRAGLTVEDVMDYEQRLQALSAEDQVLIILCHSIDDDTARRIAEHVTVRSPETKIYAPQPMCSPSALVSDVLRQLRAPQLSERTECMSSGNSARGAA